jgi:hypothetical protein
MCIWPDSSSKKVLEAECYLGSCVPQLKGQSQFHRSVRNIGLQGPEVKILCIERLG